MHLGSFLTILKEEYGSRVVETWFKAVCFLNWDAGKHTVYLRAPNLFVKDWIVRNYQTIIQIHMGRLLNVDMPEIIFVEDENAQNLNYRWPVGGTPGTSLQVVPASCMTGKDALELVSLDKRGWVHKTYLFDTFVEAPSEFSLLMPAHHNESPGDLYNPFFIYGGSGLGKTHLLHSICNGIKAKNKTAVVMYQSMDRFVSEFINAIRFNKMHKFQAKYRNVDALLIDDVQFISNKEQTQEAFFHIFNVLYESHKQIVLSVILCLIISRD